MNLQDLCERIVRDAIPATDSGATCFVPRYQIDQLREAIAAARQPPAEAQARPEKPAECADGCPALTVCDHCQWPPGPDAEAQAQGGGDVCETCDGAGHVVTYADPYDRGDVSSPEQSPCPACTTPPSGGLCVERTGDPDFPQWDAVKRLIEPAPPSAPVGVEGLREIYSAVIRALAAIVTTGGSDKIEELGAIPRSPVMDQVAAIRGQMDKLSDLAQQPAAAAAPLEMRICELRHVILHPGQPYVFTVDPNCEACRSVAGSGDYSSPAQQPAAVYQCPRCATSMEVDPTAKPAAVDGAMEFVRDIAQQKPEKPDYWSSCSQCESNIDRAEEVLAAQPGGSDNDH